MYDLWSRVRYSETDTDAKLSLIGIMNYFQDCSTFHSEDSGVGLSYYEREKKTWLLSSWHIVVDQRPFLGDKIRVSTWPYAFKGIYGMRNFAIFRETGEMLVRANSCWFLMNLETGRPLRVTEADIAPYGGNEPALSMEYAPRKIALPEKMEEAGRMEIVKHQIDTNHHVNNAQYVDMARDVLPERLQIREIRAEYKKAAVLGDRVVLKRAAVENGYVVSLCAESGDIFANVELKER